MKHLESFESFQSALPTVNVQIFDGIALQLFRFQAAENSIYKQFLTALRVNPLQITSITDIPFLPISFFKTHLVKTKDWEAQQVFSSSGTTSNQTSSHAVHNVSEYLSNAKQSFENFFGSLTDYHLLALLPSYLEQQNSSLVAMVEHFIKATKSECSGFYLHNQEKLLFDVEKLQSGNRKIIVWGVTYALLDIAEKHNLDWSKCMVIETGGMKGRRKEITREELHQILCSKLNVSKIYSEYGMTELLSQAYTKGGNLFFPSNTMKILVRDITDPLRKGLQSQTGGINVVDLANYSSIAFLETEDLGKVYENGTFEILGRADNSDVRGCNLMVE